MILCDYISTRLKLIGWPTKTGTMVAVISTYIVLVIANMLLFSDEGSKKDNRDMLPPKSKNMDKVGVNKYGDIE